MQLPCEKARKYGLQIVEQILPFCARVEIAGSIARKVPFVNDIDLVVIPNDIIALRRRFLQRCTAITRGDCNMSFETPTGVQIDVFCAIAARKDLAGPVPSNWGSILLCRIGSKEHNVKLCRRAVDLGLHWNPSVGVQDAQGKLIASETQEEIFEALKLKYVPPTRRTA